MSISNEIFQRWLYSLILAVDANFRLKSKDRQIKNDPALGMGWAHWVPDNEYHAYIDQYNTQEEVIPPAWRFYE